MPEPITVYLASDMKELLEDVARREGIALNEVIGRAVKNYLFSQQFHSLRDRLVSKAQSQGIVTDQDVFDQVS